MTDRGGKLLLVGCGKMGGAMLEGWLALGLLREEVDMRERGTELPEREPSADAENGVRQRQPAASQAGSRCAERCCR